MKAFTLLFTAHLLGDYYFQPEKLAKAKSRSLLWVLLHAAIYAAADFATLLLLGGGYIWAVIISATTHLLIDVVKQIILNSSAKQGVLTVKGERAAFTIDQALHIAIMIAASAWVARAFDIAEPPFMAGISETLGRDAYSLIAYAAVGLAVMKPANVFIRRMLFTEKPEDKSAEHGRAGRLIGCLERLLVIALLALKQYGSVALVFTAKSIARFRQLDDRDFAEYYILGTLLSVVTAVGAFILMKLFGTL
ncbi:MAG: DUF3307 domain-containing protein [Clostridia bacterium]|nr:DUF3307 domain-containing protein [Clostridia bacterium]